MRSWLSVEHAALKGRGFVALSSITYYNIPAHKQILSGRSCGLDLDYLYLFLAATLFDLAVFGRFLRSCIWIWSKYQILFVFVQNFSCHQNQFLILHSRAVDPCDLLSFVGSAAYFVLPDFNLVNGGIHVRVLQRDAFAHVPLFVAKVHCNWRIRDRGLLYI